MLALRASELVPAGFIVEGVEIGVERVAGVRHSYRVPDFRNIDSAEDFVTISHGSCACDEDRLGPPEQLSHS